MKSVKFIAVMLVLLLGLMGGAYAAWNDLLEVDGTVETGTVDVVFDSFEINYDEDANTKNGNPVALVDIDVDEANKKLTFTIDNAYPQFMANIDFTVKNEGSIPVKLQSKVVEAPYPYLDVNNSGWWCWCCMNWKWECTCEDPPDDPDPEQLEVGTQLEQGDTAEGSIGVLVSPYCDAEQGTTYTFSVEYDFIQWNKFEEQ